MAISTGYPEQFWVEKSSNFVFHWIFRAVLRGNLFEFRIPLDFEYSFGAVFIEFRIPLDFRAVLGGKVFEFRIPLDFECSFGAVLMELLGPIIK